MKVLVIGVGSAGRRHIKNLHELGCEILVYDKNIDVFRPTTGTPGLTAQMTLMEELVRDYNVGYYDPHEQHEHIDAYVIATPPAYHAEYIIQAMQRHAHVFVEKPVSNEITYMDWVANNARNHNITVQVGYQLRFHPGIVLVKKMIDEGRIGRVMSIRAEFGQYLPSWHPGEDYHKLYTGRNVDGGGILLDASHEINYVRFLADSEVREVSCFCGKLSDLEVDVEDTAEINMLFKSGIIANVHLDFTQRMYTRWCKVIGTAGTILWTYENNVAILTTYAVGEVFKVPLDDPYKIELKHFIDLVKNGEQGNVEDAIKTLQVALAAKQSSLENRVIIL